MLALLGLGVGGFYGLLACGVVVGHKGSGLINLDQGALAMYPAFTFVSVRETGDVMYAVAAVVSAMIPLFFLVLFFQRQIVSGLTAGAVKG